jgi:photosystem II stability/assembly factor-like uncharacterized protein
MSNTDPIEPRLRRYLDVHAADRPSVGLEDRILWLVREEPRHQRRVSIPRQLLAATGIAVLAVGLAAGVAYVRNHQPAAQGPAPSTSPALSIGTGGGGDWVVVRGMNVGSATQPAGAIHNVLYHTADGGQSWQDRLTFDGIYDGMSWTADGRTGALWTFEMTTPCGATAKSCNLPPSNLYTVYSTADAGLHWTQHSPKPFGDFTLVYFRGTDGWVLSQQDVAQGQPASPGAGLYRTTDGGATWTHVSDLTGLTGMQLSGGIWGHTSGVGETNFEFADAQHGWLATGLEQTASPSLLETTDGGKSWHGVTIVEAPAAVVGQQVVLGYPVLLNGGHALLPAFYGHRTDPNNFSITHRYIYSSNDGGSTWSGPPVELKAGNVQPTGNEWQNFYLDANHWWFTATNQQSSGEPVAQAGPAVARTTDGGKSWQRFSGKDAPIILQMTFTDANHGWAFAIAGPSDTTNILLRTTDGGAHWHQVQVP